VSVTTQHGRAEGVIDLARGDPGPDLLPAALVQRAAARATARLDPDLLQYGFEPGDVGARAALSDWLAREGAGEVRPERLFVTAGASLALHLVCTLFTRPGDRVLVADPTYHLALAQFVDHGLSVVGVASDAGGIVPEALEEALRAGPAALVYLVPAFANPTGTTLSPERQAAVVDLAARHGVRLVADEVYRVTGFEHGPEGARPAPPRGLAALDPERVLSLNSVSKVLAPGLRLGWIEGPVADLARIAASGVLRSGGGMNPFTAALVREAIASGELSAHVAVVRERLRERHAALASALRAELPQASFAPAGGGYFLWLRVPGLDAASTAARAAFDRHAVAIAAGAAFVAGGGSLDPREHVRLCFAHQRPDALREGVARLAAAVRDLVR
jgi:2-aminoadipate transaminase